MAVVLSSLSLMVLMCGDCCVKKEEGELSPASKVSGKETVLASVSYDSLTSTFVEESSLCRDMCRVGVDAPSNIALSKKSIVDSV